MENVPPSDLTGHRVLVVEDEIFIAVDLEDILTQMGAQVVGPVMSVDEALEIARSTVLHLAILDVWLGTGTSLPVAQLLTTRGVPFILHTANFSGDTPPSTWPQVPVVSKPATPQALSKAISRMLPDK